MRTLGRALGVGMTSPELAELLLVTLYKRAESHGYDSSFSLEDIAAESGESDRRTVTEVAKQLDQLDLIKADTDNFGTSIRILGAGSALVEKGGQKDAVRRYRESKTEPDPFPVLREVLRRLLRQ